MDSVEDVFKPLAMFLGLLYFISLMIFDARAAIVGKSARIWNPGKSLLISALTIQILSYLKVKIIKSSDFDLEKKDAFYRDILQNEFVGESGRVVTCVLIGYLLPGMARAGAATDWRTLVALVLSLFTSEFYYLTTLFYKPPRKEEFFKRRGDVALLQWEYHYLRSSNRSVTNGVIVLSIILVVLFSISAILAARTLRGMLAQKISAIQWDKRKQGEEGPWQKFKSEVVISWLLARVCNTQYVIARSALISAVGLVVTICITFLGIRQFALYASIMFLFPRYKRVFIAWMLEWAFILIGGTVIFCRWFTAVVYFPRFYVKKMKLTPTRPFVEDFWTRSVFDLVQMYNLQKWRLQVLSRDGMIPNEPALSMATTMKLHYFLYLLWPLQIWLVCFSKCCFFVSELMFSFRFLWICLFGSDKDSSQSEEFKKYEEILEEVCMPGENSESLWLANEKSMKQVKKHFDQNIDKGHNCKDFIMLIKPHFHLESDDRGRFVNQLESIPLVARHFPALDKNCMRITALSLLNVIINLFPLHRDVNKQEEAIEAYKQAFGIMSFVDDSDPQCPTTMDVLKVIDIEADRVTVAVCNKFHWLLKLHREKIDSLEKPPNMAVPGANQAIKELLGKADKDLKTLVGKNKKEQSEGEKQHVGGEEQNVRRWEKNDSRDWSAIAATYSMYRVCKLIDSLHFVNDKDLMDYLYGSLYDTIAYCLLKLPNVLVKRCREWAVKFEEEKIWEAMFIAGKVVGVMQECNVEVEVNYLEPMFPTYEDNQV